jgi:hypothetical protein
MNTSRHEPHNTFVWKPLYEAALVETDLRKLQSRIDEAQQAILDRAEELPNQPVDEEHQALRNAMAVLQALQHIAPVTLGGHEVRTMPGLLNFGLPGRGNNGPN